MSFRRNLARAALLACAAAVVAFAAAGGAGAARGSDQLRKINHIVVIYEENHSFDNLYGGWEGVNGRQNADPAHTIQVDQNGQPYSCLLQNDVNLVNLPATCNDAAHGFSSAFTNWFWTIDQYLPPSATTCPTILGAFAFPFGVPNGRGLPGGCTRDLVHKFYQEQYQLNGGAQNRYATGSDSAGMSMGVYDTKALPIYKYLHGGNHPHYAIADDFFQAAFGGSFLNHQWLIAATTPTVPNAPQDGSSADRHSVVDVNGMVQTRAFNTTWGLATYPLYVSPSPAIIRDREWTVKCGSTPLPLACGDYAVNTSQPVYRPFGAFGAKLPPQTNPTIGDRLSAAGIDWAWYAGGWANAAGDTSDPGYTNGAPTGDPNQKCSDPNVDPSAGIAVYPYCPSNLFQYHHQPFNYFKAFDPSTPAGLANRQAHLKDEVDFIQAADASGSSCQLKPVSFVKPFGTENEHPGYSSESGSDSHLVSLLETIEGSACAKDTMVIVTYDEFGGQWDHVPPPGQAGTPGPHDQWGPGTRIPALIVSPFLRGNFVVDHTQYDTTSILATIEARYGLAPLGSRDAAVNDLSNVFAAKQVEAAG
jgi:phospholipase C